MINFSIPMEVHNGIGKCKDNDRGNIFNKDDICMDQVMYCVNTEYLGSTASNFNRLHFSEPTIDDTDSVISDDCGEIFDDEDEYLDHLASSDNSSCTDVRNRISGKLVSLKLGDYNSGSHTFGICGERLDEKDKFQHHLVPSSNTECINDTSSMCVSNFSKTKNFGEASCVCINRGEIFGDKNKYLSYPESCSNCVHTTATNYNLHNISSKLICHDLVPPKNLNSEQLSFTSSKFNQSSSQSNSYELESLGPRSYNFEPQSCNIRQKSALDPVNYDLYFLICKICNKQYASKSSLETHSLIHAGIRNHVCHICNKAFTQKFNLRRHMKVHETRYKCRVCAESFRQECTFLNHIRIHDNTEVLYIEHNLNNERRRKEENVLQFMKIHKKIEDQHIKCNICKEVFLKDEDLLKHKKTHENIRINLNCDISNELHIEEENSFCKKSEDQYIKSEVSEASLLRDKTHIKIDLVCDICDESFLDKYDLFNHVKIHEGEELFCCDYCDRIFNEEKKHLDHQLSCPGNKVSGNMDLKISPPKSGPNDTKPFCEICNKQFSSKQYFQTHKLIHSGIKNHTCNVCNKSFNIKYSFSRHMKIHDSNRLMYTCDICKKRLSTKSLIASHMRSQHMDGVTKRRNKIKTYKDNMKMYKCDVCNQECIRKVGLTRHKSVHERDSMKMYKCEVYNQECDEKVGLLKHKSVHKSYSVKMYTCEICNRKCVGKVGLVKHKTVHESDQQYIK